ncbi:dipeptidase [Sphingorhabdus sp.]|uniref:dipeptidase n=1 Tax=Sphingorhabdus sp. TaxID=1902408 RepID=UPI003593CC4A
MRSPTAGDTDIPRLHQGGVGAILMNVFSREKSTKDTLAAFDFLRELEAKYGDTFKVAATAADVRSIRKAGRIALIPTMEGAGRLENSPMMLRTLHRLGLRAVTLAYQTNDLADGSDDAPRHNGLSVLGRTMVAEMNRTGVLIDLSHVSTKVMNDVLDITTAPVLFSHSSARAIVNVERNVPDAVLARISQNGGIVMISFVPYFSSKAHAEWAKGTESMSDQIGKDFEAKRITEAEGDARWTKWQKDNPEPKVGVGEVADHIEHVRRIAGVDHIGIGSDFDGISNKVTGLEDVSKFPNLFAELRQRGWSENDLAKLAGENFLRVMEVAEKTAAATVEAEGR